CRKDQPEQTLPIRSRGARHRPVPSCQAAEVPSLFGQSPFWTLGYRYSHPVKEREKISPRHPHVLSRPVRYLPVRSDRVVRYLLKHLTVYISQPITPFYVR